MEFGPDPVTQETRPRPAWLRAVILALAAGPYVGAGREAGRTLILQQPWHWDEMLLYVGIWTLSIALFAGLVSILRRRRPGSDHARGRAMVEHALASGSLPEQENAAAWRTTLAAEARQSRQARRALWALGLLVVALVTAAAVISGSVAVGSLAALLAVGLVVPDRRLARRAGRAEDLLAGL